MTPQPSLTIKEPTTTPASPYKTAAAGSDELHWPHLFVGEKRDSAMQILSDCPPKDRQRVLHEIAGIADRGSVRHPLGLLRNLVDRAMHGRFVPSAALEWEKKIKSRTRDELQNTEGKKLRQQNPAPHLREIGRTVLTECRQQIGAPPIRIDSEEQR